MTDAQAPPIFNPLEPGYVEDPWPHLAEIRDEDPVHHMLTGQWGLFRYSDIFTLLRDPTLSVDDSKAAHELSDRFAQFERVAAGDVSPNHSILNTDPPDHTRMRRLLSKAFTPRTIEGLRPVIEEMVDAALDSMAAEGRPDLVAGLAFPLPFDVISAMLGMPEADKVQIREWSGALVKTIDPVITDEEIEAAMQAGIKMDALIDEVIAWKRANPASDLLTSLIEAEDDGDRLSAAELRDQVSLLFVAGHETTVNLIGTGIFELLRNPDQLERWRADPSLAGPAVDELLRFVSPVQITRRITVAPYECGGKTIPQGAFVLASLASANRDPDFWGPTADQLDLGRDLAGQHLSFGSGVHFCLGSSLAKLEAEVAIGRFIGRFGTPSVVGEPVWNGRINLRGLDRLVVDLG